MNFEEEEEENDKILLVDTNNNNVPNNMTDKFDPKFQKDMNTILSMGYDMKMMRKVYMFLKPGDINEALDYMSNEGGKYHHEFMESHGQANKCFICGAPPENHINYQPKTKKTSIIESIRESIGSSKKNDTEEINEPLIQLETIENKEDDNNNNDNEEKYCELCMEPMKASEVNQNKLECEHLFCNDCYLNYFQDKITNNKVGKIQCMQFKCPHVFDDNFVISHLSGDQNLINKYNKFKLRNKLYEDENVKFCPNRDCESYARKEGDNKYVTCQEGHQFCWNCFKPWHGKKECQEEIDKDFSKWKKSKKLKRCPKCKFWTEKNRGCNHMTCPECKYQWCWFCLQECQLGHFKVGGSCYGLQFTDKTCYNYCLVLYAYKLSVFLFQSILLIFYAHLLIIFYGRNISGNPFLDRQPKFLYYAIIIPMLLVYFFFLIGLGTVHCLICSIICCLKQKAIRFLLDLGGY